MKQSDGEFRISISPVSSVLKLICIGSRDSICLMNREFLLLYAHFPNGLMHVVVDRYDTHSRDAVVWFVNRIVRCSLSLFR